MDEIEKDPALLHDIDIGFGSFRREWWQLATRMRWFQTLSAGVDSLLTPEAREHDTIITNVHIHAEPIVEQVFGMLLMLTRRLQVAYRQQMTHSWTDVGSQDVLAGKTLGIVGVGTIGMHAAKVGQAFGMRILGMRRHHGEATSPIAQIFLPSAKSEMFPQCDYLLVSLPLTQETCHFIDSAAFSLMKPGAVIINVGRGRLIDTSALLEALRSGHLGGACLDVTDPEPLPPDHPLWDMPNVIITPHNSGLHPDYLFHATDVFLQNLQRYLAGEPLHNVIDKQAGY